MRIRFPPSILASMASLAVISAGAGVLALVVSSKHRARPPLSERDVHPYLELHAPCVATPIRIDAEMDGKKVWESEAGSTGNFKDADGRGMVPYTEAKVRWREGVLYLWLYAGDLDLEGSVTAHDGPVSQDDSFHIELGGEKFDYAIDVSLLGTVADSTCARPSTPGREASRCDPRWESGAVVAVDRDGTVNRVGDNDEEWIVEMAIPLSSLGMQGAMSGTRIPFRVDRCDVGSQGKHACGAFGAGEPRAEIVLDGPDDGTHVASAKP